MRLRAYAAVLAACSQPAMAQTGPQADLAGATPVVVAPEALSGAQLERIKRDLGVQSSSAIGATGSEIWQVPTANLGEAFAAARRNKKLTLDYRGDDYRELFLPVNDSDLGPAASQALERVRQNPRLSEVQVVRLRAEEISSRMLTSGFGTADGLPSAGSLLLKVRPGLDVVMQRKSLEEKGDQLSWSGSAAAYSADAPPTAAVPPAITDGDATLVARGDKILGTIQVGTERYSVIPLSNGLHAVAKVNQDAFPPEHPPMPQGPAPAGDVPMMDLPAAAAAPPSPPAEVMIGVAFTQAALNAIQANYNVTPDQLAEQVIALTNVGYQASGITSHLKLAGTQLIPGAEKPDFDSMVDAVVSPNDGAFDSVHAWRKSVKADAVLVLVALDAYCGMAADIYTPAPKAYALVNWSCAKDNLSFPHEFGHLLGARHNPEDDPSNQPFAYAHGHRVQWWRTVMSYAGGNCLAPCPRINRWSNPTQQYNGVALGTPNVSHDARLLEEMLPVFSTYVP